MTRDQITTLVTQTVGQTDSASVSLCNDFVQRAYEMVWNAELWHDTVTIDTTSAVIAGNNTFTMPAGFERIVSLQLLFAGVPIGFLDPTTTAFVQQTEPTALSTTNPGVPTKYEEFVHTDGTRKVRVFPVPDLGYTLTMSAKRVCPTLGGSDTLQIRNIDNAVIALATADMYTRLRQLGKAAEMAKKAGAFIEEARKIEFEQSNKPRIAKTPTVTTNTLTELVDAVCLKAGSWTPDSVILARNFLKRRYRSIWDKYLWSDTIVHATASTVNAQNYIVTPATVERVVSVSVNGVLLDPVDVPSLLQIDPAILSSSGQPKYFQEIDTGGVKQIRLLPVPDAIYTVVVAGKKPITNFVNNTDVSAIRNIDNALIAFAASDLQQRLGDKESAKASLEEAAAELKSAIDLEADQAFKIRKTKALSVSSNSLSELADEVCARCGTYIPENVILAKDFVKRRYRMIYDSYLWRDSLTTADTATVNAQNYVAMPAGIERAVSVIVNGTMMEPVDSAYLMQIDPTIFTRSGVPTVFEEIDVTGVKRIKLLPIPDAIYSVTVAGKKTLTNLSADTDTPIIRNIDSALIAFATSDLHMRLGHAQEAQASLQEAGAQLEALKELESQQTVRARAARPLTVSGDSLREMADAVCSRTGQFKLDSVDLAKEFLRRNYKTVYDAALWAESTVAIDVTSATSTLILPEHVDRVISVRGNANLGQLSAVQPSVYYGINPWIFEQTGDPLAFSYLTPVAVSVLPTAAERLSLVSSSSSDKTKVMVRGETSFGSVVAESVTLNGTTPVLTVNSYAVPLTIAKNVTTGNVTVSGNTSATQFVQLLAAERERKHMRLWLQPTPTANVTCKVLCKRRITPLVQDEDTPLLRDIGNVLIELSVADMFSKIGNAQGSVGARTKAEAAMKTLIDLEMNQGAVTAQVVPEVEYAGGYEYADDWMVAKA